MSSAAVSRAKTTREKPYSFARRAPHSLQQPACVERCSVICGYASFKTFPRKISCNNTASAPHSYAVRAASKKPSVSSSFTSVFKQTYTFAPSKWACRTVARNSSRAKFAAPSRAEKRVMPKYTASAPAFKAARAVAVSPAGARISIPLSTYRALNQLLRRIVTHALQAEIARRHLDENGKIASGRNGHREFRHFYA